MINNSRKKWLCPFCPHRSSRKGNMQVHIQRWHERNKEPLYIGDRTETLLKYKKEQHSSGSVNNIISSGSSFFLSISLFQKSQSQCSKFINKLHSQVVEARGIPRKIEEIKSFFNGDLSYVPQLYTNKSLGNIALANFGKPLVPYIPLPPFCANTLSPSFTFAPAIDSQGTRKEEVAGFAAKICDDCTKIVIETKYGVDESGKDPIVITRNSHICFCPLKPSTLESAVRNLSTFQQT